MKMSENKIDKIKYYLTFPIYILLGLAFAGVLKEAGTDDINIGFFLCYIEVDLMVLIICKLLGLERWNVVAAAVVTAILALVFWDKILFVNMLTAFLVILIIYILNLKKIRYWSWALATIVLSVSWILNTSNIPRYAGVCLTVLIFYSLSILIKKDAAFYMAVPAIIAIITIFTPVYEKPCQWTYVKKVINSTGNFLGKLIDEGAYLFEGLGISGGNYSGYSESGKISGGIIDNDREELLFEDRYNTRKTMLYLKGRSFVSMGKKGFSDKDTSDTSGNAWFALFMNALYHVGYDKNEASFFSNIVVSDVKYRYLRTYDTIMPLTTFDVSGDTNNGKKKKKGYSYTVKYFLIDYGSPYFERLAKGSDMPYESYETIAEYTKEIYSIDLNDIMTKEEYEASLSPKDMSIYLDTEMATDRIIELTNEITKDADSDYEKAQMIEAYLRQYEYNDSIDLSGKDNYVEDFLFVTQKGYCVHYASAMVLMLRIAGIPSRYSVGYVHDNKASSSILGSDAHAWPEAYIEGFGWVPFEPTGAYKTAEEYTWKLGLNYVKKTEEYGENNDDKTDDKKEENYHKPNDEVVDIPKPDMLKEEKEDKILDRSFIKKFAGYAAMIIGASLIVFLLVCLIRYIRYRLMTTEQKLKENMKRIFRILENADNEKFEFELKNDLKTLIDSYRRIRFRGDAADEAVVRLSGKVYKMLKNVGSKSKI